MITQKIAMIGKKTDQDILRVRTCFDRIENSAKTMIQITDLAVISGLYDSGQRRIDCVCPNGMSHVRNLVVQVIFLDLTENEIGHSVGIVHPIERNWRSERRMRSEK
jgi:hypothetical protein